MGLFLNIFRETDCVSYTPLRGCERLSVDHEVGVTCWRQAEEGAKNVKPETVLRNDGQPPRLTRVDHPLLLEKCPANNGEARASNNNRRNSR